MTDEKKERYARNNGPMHHWFGLGRDSYLVLERAVIQEMPVEWQTKMVALLEEASEAFSIKTEVAYQVLQRHPNGSTSEGPWADYRRGPVPPRKGGAAS